MNPFDNTAVEMPDIANDTQVEVAGKLDWVGMNEIEMPVRIEDGAISNTAAKTVFDALWEEHGDIDGIIDAKGLRQIRNTDELAGIVARIVDKYPRQVADLTAGQTKILGFLVGQVMRATRGKADPRQVNALLKETHGIR